MDKAKAFLAEEILVERRVVTYRYLSRALKIHVNAAKKALFDFHGSQNAKKPGSVYATYLIYGANLGNSADGMDVDDSSPEDELLFEPVPKFFLTLVSEEDFEAALSKYTSIEAIHVYSVSAQPMTDLQLLSDSARQIAELRGSQGLEENPAKVYGTIPNSHVRRRQRKGQAPGPVGTTAGPAKPKAGLTPEDVPKPNSVWNKTAAAKTTDSTPSPGSIWNRLPNKPVASTKSDANAPSEPSTQASSVAEAKKPGPPATLKRAGSSASSGGIMGAFAKGAAAAAAKPKKALVPKKDDIVMAMSDDDGDDIDDGDDGSGVLPKAQAVTGGKSRKDREAALRQMMDDNDDDANDNDEDKDADEDDEDREDTPMADAADAELAEPVEPDKQAEEPGEVVSMSTGDGRRRGKRRVMRKKMIEDEKGYLVTIQEPGWESFSEDEAPSKPAQTAVRTPAAQAPAKPKNPTAKAGQGNIMSFFSKK